MVDSIQKRQLLRESVCRSLMEAYQTGKGAAEEAAILRGYARTLALTYDENLLQAVRWMWGNENSTTEQAVLLAECMAGCFEAMAALLVKAKDGEGVRHGSNDQRTNPPSVSEWARP